MELFYYSLKDDNTAKIVRCFGDTDEVVIPSEINGYRVSEIGEYCFAPVNRSVEFISDENVHTNLLPHEISKISDFITEQCGKYIKKVVLSNSIEKISGCAFYNCTALSYISFGEKLEEVGADAFMNCSSLFLLKYCGEPGNKSVLKNILTQISWNIAVELSGEDDTAGLYFPEYSQVYDEIGPAHIFELNIQGEGFRARQCFREGRFDYSEYDAVFKHACAEESEANLCMMGLYRIIKPYELSDSAFMEYKNYLCKSDYLGEVIIRHFWDDDCFFDNNIELLLSKGCLNENATSKILLEAVEMENSKRSAKLSDLKQKYFSKSLEDKYSFEEF